jgi:hypothetical protein
LKIIKKSQEDNMMNEKIQKGFMLLAIIAAALLAFSPAQAVDVGLSGQINRAMMYVDDGSTGKWFFVDNENSSTRFRFTGSNDFENSWKVGIVWEVEMQSNSSNEVSMDNTDISDVKLKERKLEFWVGHDYGKAWLGQGDMASNSTSEVDLSGTTVAAYSAMADVAGAFKFQDNGSDISPTVTVGGSRSNFDGLSRQDRLRYDTPKFAGFYGSVSTASKSRWDAALRYAGDLGWGKLAAAAAYADLGTSEKASATNVGKDAIISSSASLLLPMGLNFTVSYAKRDQDNTDPWNLFGKVGYQFMEKHAASIQYGRTENLSAKDDKGDSVSLAYVFSPWKSVEFYANFTKHMRDRDVGDDPDDINVGFFGGRVKF